MRVHAPRRLCEIALAAVLLAGAGPLFAGDGGQQTSNPILHDDRQRFVVFYGQLQKPLTVFETWRVLRGLRRQLEELGQPRRVAGITYYAGGDLYLAAFDFGASEVFIDHVGSERAFTLTWTQIEPDFGPRWRLSGPDRIQSSEPGRRL